MRFINFHLNLWKWGEFDQIKTLPAQTAQLLVNKKKKVFILLFLHAGAREAHFNLM